MCIRHISRQNKNKLFTNLIHTNEMVIKKGHKEAKEADPDPDSDHDDLDIDIDDEDDIHSI